MSIPNTYKKSLTEKKKRKKACKHNLKYGTPSLKKKKTKDFNN